MMSVAAAHGCGHYGLEYENGPRVGSAEPAEIETYRHLPVRKLGKRGCPQIAHPRAATQGVCL